mmetsp:Transcript_49418/g.92626  ORF Transcript_49418/g.92626 Transcript_49418/m.92626 type:complete len:243 (-) Transcript_49418:11-739(-)
MPVSKCQRRMTRLFKLLLTLAIGDVRGDGGLETVSFVPNRHFAVVGQNATRVDGACWRVIEIGSWFESGTRAATIQVDSVSEDQAPGVSLAVGVLFRNVEGRVNDPLLSSASCGDEYHWSVKYGHNQGLEYLGNKWGTAYGPRLYNGDLVSMFVDMDRLTIAFSVNGVCYGALSLEDSGRRVVLAAALSRRDTITLKTGNSEDVPECLAESSLVAAAAPVAQAKPLLTGSAVLVACLGALIH